MNSNAIVKLETISDLMTLGEIFVKSGFFTDSQSAAKAVVKIMAGAEMGVGPFQAMNSIDIIQGRPVPSANLMAAVIKRDPRYDYRVTEHTETVCEIAYYDNGKEIGRSRYTIEDARHAGLTGKDNWKKYPANMLFARAMSNGAKWYCPDAFPGPVYTPDELGAEVDGETGEIIQSTAIVVEGAPEPPPAPPAPRAPAKTAPRRSARPPAQKPGNGDGGEAAPHWIEDDERRKRFWAWTADQGLSHSEVHEALGVSSLKEFAGEPGDAMNAITAYIAAHVDAPPADAPDAEPAAGDEVPFEQEGGELHKATQSELAEWFGPKDGPTEAQAKAAIEGGTPK